MTSAGVLLRGVGIAHDVYLVLLLFLCNKKSFVPYCLLVMTSFRSDVVV